jgi:hypothetical protein
MFLIIEVMLSQHIALVDRQQSKDNPEVQKDDEKPLELINRLRLQLMTLTRDDYASFRHGRTLRPWFPSQTDIKSVSAGKPIGTR